MCVHKLKKNKKKKGGGKKKKKEGGGGGGGGVVVPQICFDTSSHTLSFRSESRE